MRKPKSVAKLVELGRVQLSKTFFLRDFLFSDIAAIHGFSNIPDDPDLAIETGKRLCEDLLEPLQDRFGRLAIRSAYRSAEVNAAGAGRSDYGCASNEKNAAHHIWDMLDADGCKGATACIVVPSFAAQFDRPGDWRRLAWWVHDHLPYGSMEFFPVRWAFNLSWHERPVRSIYSYIPDDRGYLLRPGATPPIGYDAAWRGHL